jgi:sulfofructose kinase
MPQFDICGLGGCCWDAVGLVESYPQLDEKRPLLDLVEMGGGLAATAVAAAARLGARCAMFGCVGDDDHGHKIINGLQSGGVDTSGLAVLPGESSQFAFCIAHQPTGQRTIYWRPGSYDRLGPGQINLTLATDCRCVLVDHHHLGAATELATVARAQGLPVVADVERWQPGIEALLSACTHPVVPRRFAAALSASGNVLEGVGLMQRWGAQVVVVTAGELGATAFIGDQQYHQPAFAVTPLVDTTGAGDVFHGAFACALTRHFDLPEALTFAAAAAALSCRGLGGRGALPTRTEVEALISATSSS